MGIRGFSTFIKTHFIRWKKTDFEKWDNVIIDGNNVCYQLYKKFFPWELGEYRKFSNRVRRCFYGMKNPIVVFDGIRNKEDIDAHKICEKRLESFEAMQKQQRQMEWDPHTIIPESTSIIPLMIPATFFSVLEELDGIEIRYANAGDADREIAELANTLRCPVISSDSDFFFFNLECGLVYFDRHFVDKKEDSLYLISEFQEQFKLSYGMCLIIPASSKEYKNYLELVYNLEKYSSPEKYFSSPNAIKMYEDLKKHYSLHDLPAQRSIQIGKISKEMYKHLISNCFPTNLLVAYRDKVNILPQVVDDINKESAWRISGHIRECMYGIMGMSAGDKVHEIYRPKPYIQHFLSPKILEIQKAKHLILKVLKCCKIKKCIYSIDGKWKLPLAATFYWHQYCILDLPPARKRELLKCLLLSFLSCSGSVKLREEMSVKVTQESKEEYLAALHAFAQWKCVYHDTMALNILVCNPFPTTSPADLFSGEIVMHYALVSVKKENWLEDIIRQPSEEWDIFNKFLTCLECSTQETETEDGASQNEGWTFKH